MYILLWDIEGIHPWGIALLRGLSEAVPEETKQIINKRRGMYGDVLAMLWRRKGELNVVQNVYTFIRSYAFHPFLGCDMKTS